MADENKYSGNDERLRDAEKRAGRDKPFGRGMTSPDSTQVPLSAETGEPDERARGGSPDDDRGHQGRNESRR